MFYSSDLLVFKSGKFSLIWLAATRGESHLSRKDLGAVDIRASCFELLEYIKLKQSLKLSLYLSSQLTFGICVIYRKKIDKLLYDLQELYKKSLPLTISVKSLSNKQKGHNKMSSNNISLTNVMEDFPLYNDSFGLINDLDNSLINKDSVNCNTSINQARIEDITFMEYDNVPSTLKNYLENDLEPLNIELIQELLGASDTQTDFEVLLQKPFNSIIEVNKELNMSFCQPNVAPDVDMDIEITINNNDTLNQNVVIESSYMQNIRKEDNKVNNFIERNFNLDHLDKVKSSRVIEEVEICKSNEVVEVIDLQYPANRKSQINKFVDFKLDENLVKRSSLKRKAVIRPILVDNITTISHQVIRDNMDRHKFCLVDKNSLFPNALISRSLQAQIACSAPNLFEFPGNFKVLKSRQLLSLWMKRKTACLNAKRINLKYEKNVSVAIPTIAEDIFNEISDLSIERGRFSSKRTTMQMDSFTIGSDSLQRSIQQVSFEGDKTLDDVNKQIFDESVSHQVDVTMLPIIEEDICNRQNEMVEVPVVDSDVKMVDKSEVWSMIKGKFKEKLNDYFTEDQVRVSFFELCPIGSLKKNAAIFFITLLRLAKYKKIRMFQDKFDSEIFIGLPLEAT